MNQQRIDKKTLYVQNDISNAAYNKMISLREAAGHTAAIDDYMVQNEHLSDLFTAYVENYPGQMRRDREAQNL